MSTETLLLSGAAFMNRLISRKSPNLNLQLVSPAIDTTPKLFPSQFISELGTSSVQFPQNDVITLNRLSSGGFLYPCGLPSLEFFLPDGNDSSLSVPMLLFPKRTYQPSTIRRKRNHGFLARKATKGGHRVIIRRIAKGRPRITA